MRFAPRKVALVLFFLLGLSLAFVAPTLAAEPVGTCTCTIDLTASDQNGFTDNQCDAVLPYCNACVAKDKTLNGCKVTIPNLTSGQCNFNDADVTKKIIQQGATGANSQCRWSAPGSAHCADLGTPAEVKALADQTKTDPNTWTCQTIEDTGPAQCISSVDCSGGQQCCPPGSGAGTQPAAPAAPAAPTGSTGPVSWIPASLSKCMQSGDCSLDDIVAVGAAFANFMFGLSGAVALVILIYGGILYLTAGGGAEQVTKANKMMVSAAIGLVCIFGANALIRYVYTSFTRQTTTPTDCEKLAGFSCKVVTAADDKARDAAADALGCQPKKPKDLCAAPDQGAGVYCCPLEPKK